MHVSQSYLDLGESFYQTSAPKRFPNPSLLLFNHTLAESLGLQNDEGTLTKLLSGQQTLGSVSPAALAYAGHQFGHFNPRLGDGRAHYLGELQDKTGTLWEIQLKGSGPTPFSRGGDGLCALGPALREFIMSAALTGLGLPTTQSLSVVTTGEHVFREGPSKGAVVSRVARSHIRIGTFQYFAYRGNTAALEQLANYTLQRHYPHVHQTTLNAAPKERCAALLEAVMQKHVELICEWMRVGFIHGVMNTDNSTLSGDTIDFGPCAMLGAYDPNTAYSSIDTQGRYAFGNQPSIALWNLSRFAECLMPLIDAEDGDNATATLEPILRRFRSEYQKHHQSMMCKKMGYHTPSPSAERLSEQWLALLHTHKLDYTQNFHRLEQHMRGAALEHAPPELQTFIQRWKEDIAQQQSTTETLNCLHRSNPYIIPRNHLVEKAIQACVEEHNTQPAQALIEALRKPYDQNATSDVFNETPNDGDAGYKTFCGT